MTEIDVYGRLSIGLEGLRDELRASREHAQRQPPQPSERRIINSAAFPSSGVLGLNMGGPQQGHFWHVRSIAVGGATPTTTEAGRADVFASSSPAQILAGQPAAGSQPGSGGVFFATGFAAGALNTWRDQTTALPNVAFYGAGDLTIHASEQLWIVFSNGTSTDLLIANARIDDFESAAYGFARHT